MNENYDYEYEIENLKAQNRELLEKNEKLQDLCQGILDVLYDLLDTMKYHTVNYEDQYNKLLHEYNRL